MKRIDNGLFRSERTARYTSDGDWALVAQSGLPGLKAVTGLQLPEPPVWDFFSGIVLARQEECFRNVGFSAGERDDADRLSAWFGILHHPYDSLMEIVTANVHGAKRGKPFNMKLRAFYMGERGFWFIPEKRRFELAELMLASVDAEDLQQRLRSEYFRGVLPWCEDE
jgi:hypothetical protein